MAQKIVGYVRFQVPAGKATPAPPVGPALGQYGINIGQFTKDFNERTKGDMGILLRLLNPFAPHITEELWENLGFAGGKGMACRQPWPVYDESKTVAAEVNMAVQVGGKLRATITVALDSEQDAVVAAALQDPKVQKFIGGMDIVKGILVKNKLVNLIVKPKA